MNIDFQLFIWVVFSVIGGFATYIILTEGKSRFLLVITIFFDLFLGMGTSYIWLQTTRGLALYSWALYVLPLLISCIVTILFLSYYKAYHDKKSFPRIPTFSASRASSLISLVVIVVLSVVLASLSFPSTAPSPTISMLGSTASTTLSEKDIVNTSDCLDCIKSGDILMQKSMVSPTSFREDPMTGEYLNFKVEFTPSFSYLNPTMKLFVKDLNNELIPTSNIITNPVSPNALEGQIYCDKSGIYTITAVIYDTGLSSTRPIASQTLSYIVTDANSMTSTKPTDPFLMYMIVFLAIIVILIWAVAIYKKVS